MYVWELLEWCVAKLLQQDSLALLKVVTFNYWNSIIELWYITIKHLENQNLSLYSLFAWKFLLVSEYFPYFCQGNVFLWGRRLGENSISSSKTEFIFKGKSKSKPKLLPLKTISGVYYVLTKHFSLKDFILKAIQILHNSKIMLESGLNKIIKSRKSVRLGTLHSRFHSRAG